MIAKKTRFRPLDFAIIALCVALGVYVYFRIKYGLDRFDSCPDNLCYVSTFEKSNRENAGNKLCEKGFLGEKNRKNRLGAVGSATNKILQTQKWHDLIDDKKVENKNSIKKLVKPETFKNYTEFYQCNNPSCNKVFWHGPHIIDINKKINNEADIQ
ncbi:hypothetical protein ES708_33944 [subsurface metagenome]